MSTKLLSASLKITNDNFAKYISVAYRKCKVPELKAKAALGCEVSSQVLLLPFRYGYD